MSHRMQAAFARAVLCLLLIVVLALPASAGGVNLGNLRPFVLAILDDVGLVDSTGTNAAALGPASSTADYVSVFSDTTGKVLDDRPVTVASTGVLSWPTGLGAIANITGPADQSLRIRGASTVRLGTGSTDLWQVHADGFYPLADNAEDLGLPAARVRTGYFGTSVNLGTVGTDGVRLEVDGTTGYLAPREGDDSAATGLVVADGSAAAPSIVGADTDSGVYFGDNTVGIATNGVARLIVGSTISFNGNTAYYWLLRTTAYTGDATLASASIQGLVTNEGAAGEVILTLPTATAGMCFEAVVATGQYLRLKANTGDTIRDAATVSASAGYIRANTQGNTVRLAAINATEWIVLAKQGTWTVDS